MYDIEKINNWKAKVQSDIDDLIASHLVELNEIVKEEVPKNFTVYCRMGTCTIEDANGKSIYDGGVVERFENELANLSYRDAFLSNACIDEINVPKSSI